LPRRSILSDAMCRILDLAKGKYVTDSLTVYGYIDEDGYRCVNVALRSYR
jgi:hypothetical protein